MKTEELIAKLRKLAKWYDDPGETFIIGSGVAAQHVKLLTQAANALTEREERIKELEAVTEKLVLFRNPEEEILRYAQLCVESSEELGRELLHEDLCRLSRAFLRAADLRDDTDRRINERLKAMIACALPATSTPEPT